MGGHVAGEELKQLTDVSSQFRGVGGERRELGAGLRSSGEVEVREEDHWRSRYIVVF